MYDRKGMELVLLPIGDFYRSMYPLVATPLNPLTVTHFGAAITLLRQAARSVKISHLKRSEAIAMTQAQLRFSTFAEYAALDPAELPEVSFLGVTAICPLLLNS
jgi:hypothetical protein